MGFPVQFNNIMIPTLPFWLKQRQVKAEPAGENALKLTAPNMPGHEIQVRPDGGWSAVLFELSPDSGEKKPLAETEVRFDHPHLAWQAAFELFRQSVIV